MLYKFETPEQCHRGIRKGHALTNIETQTERMAVEEGEGETQTERKDVAEGEGEVIPLA